MTTIGVPVPPVNPMRRTVSNCKRVLVAFILPGIFGIVLAVMSHSMGNWPLTVVAILANIFGWLGALLSLVIYFAYKKQAHQVDEIISGTRTLGHWRCTPQEWARHIQTERELSKKSFRVIYLILIAPLIVLIICVISVAHTSKDPLPLSMYLTLGGIYVFIAAMVLGIGWLAATLPVRRLKHPDNQEVFIGGDGLILGGKFISWKLYFAKLETVRYEPGDPGWILFRWMQPGAGYYGTPAVQEVRAPVPKFADAAARNIVQVFANEFNGPFAL
jgi:hypothetical protein